MSLFLSSLDARADFEIAKIMEDDDSMTLSLHQAECVGYQSSKRGVSEVPALFKAVPALRKAWLTGWKSSEFWSDI